jgi:hypothetical protein
MRAGVAMLVLAAAAVSAALAVAAPPQKAPLTTRTIVYGSAITLTGKSPVSFKVPNADVLSRPCRVTEFSNIARPAIAASGRFTFRSGPTLNTAFRVLIADREVLNVSVLVKPAITIRRAAGGMFHVEVTTGNGAGLGGRSVLLQQQSGKAWRRVGSVKLKLISRPDQIDAVAAGDGTASLQGAGRVRAFLTAHQARPCFISSASASAS